MCTAFASAVSGTAAEYGAPDSTMGSTISQTVSTAMTYDAVPGKSAGYVDAPTTYTAPATGMYSGATFATYSSKKKEPCYLHIFPRRSPALNSYFADKAVASVFGALLAQSMGDIGCKA